MEESETAQIKASPSSPPPPPRSKKSDRVADDGTLTVYSKRSERRRKKEQHKQPKPLLSTLTLLDLPFDILLQILTLLRPSDNFRLARTCHSLYTFILQEHPFRIANALIRWRYHCLAKCFRLPVPVSEVKQGEYRNALLDEERLGEWEADAKKRNFQHIKALDPRVVCRCLTCVLRWNVLCLAVDFAHWQDVLDHVGKGKKGQGKEKKDSDDVLPVIPRGRQPEWNRKLLDAHAAVVEKALGLSENPPKVSLLWHAVILEAHLSSTTRSIRRHRANKFNKRSRFLMTEADALSETDEFLTKKGPPSVDFPFSRDNYYMLEAYLPNRSWFSEEGRWGYMPAEQHEKDLEAIRRWGVWKREQARKTREKRVLEEKEREKGNADGNDGGKDTLMTTWTMQFEGCGWKPTFILDGGRRQEKSRDVKTVGVN